MDSLSLVEGSIVTGSEGLFDEPSNRENLHVTLRIARDFYEFLSGAGEHASPGDIDYVIGTIRSGLDHFFALAYACAVIDTPRSSWDIDARGGHDFAMLKEDFIRGFERLAGSAPAGVVERLAWLLSLVRLELLFVAHHFPSALLDRSIGNGSDRR
jgi:hypothetical protein